MDPSAPPPSSRPEHVAAQVTRVRAGAIAPGAEGDNLAEETPVALEFNGISHATMLATPADLEDFAVGFSLSEGIIDSVTDVRGIDVLPQCDGIVVHEGKLASLQRFKDAVKEVASGYECGLSFEKFNDIKLGDVVEAYIMEQIEQ